MVNEHTNWRRRTWRRRERTTDELANRPADELGLDHADWDELKESASC